MKRLLLVTYVFPPAPSPGAQRPGYLARYLTGHGWDVMVLTHSAGVPPFRCNVVSTATPGTASFQERLANRAVGQPLRAGPLRRVLRGVKEAVLFPDATAPWIPRALATGRKLLQSQRFDAILSTAHPPSVHVIGWMLSKEFQTPWIADFRDPWAGNAYLKRGPVRRFLEESLERGMLRRARALTTVSDAVAEQLCRFHRRRDVVAIPNGYDPADWDPIPDAVPARFDLCYTGSMYDGKRSPDMLFDAIAQLRSENDPAGMEARVHFFGPNSHNVAASAAHYNVNLVVRQHGAVSRAEAMRAQRGSAVLLIFLNMDPATNREMGSKYLEYIGARRPILAIGPRASVMRDFIERHSLGWFASDTAEAIAALRLAYRQYASGMPEMLPRPHGIPTARGMAQEFANVLDLSVGVDCTDEQSVFVREA